ncbi:hypothetical protein [Bartonella quintana]|uniref:hypothetical protein n=1 Tax=Bartonella quintana TaxID=803 RepID=UPI0002DBEE49|nr:hypothetical protein [Bartonella quintana]
MRVLNHANFPVKEQRDKDLAVHHHQNVMVYVHSARDPAMTGHAGQSCFAMGSS